MDASRRNGAPATTILGDLGPAATFIAANYNIPFDVDEFAEAAQRILDEVEGELGWMYKTLHTDGRTKGRINYTVWSEVFLCPECSTDVVFLKEALDQDTKRTRIAFPCPQCGAEPQQEDSPAPPKGPARHRHRLLPTDDQPHAGSCRLLDRKTPSPKGA